MNTNLANEDSFIDQSQIGHLISRLLHTKAVGRRRLAGGAHPGGRMSIPVATECVKCEAFVSGTWETFIFNPFDSDRSMSC